MLTINKLFYSKFWIVLICLVQGLIEPHITNAEQPSGTDISKKVQQAFERIISKPPPFGLPFKVIEGDWNTSDLKQSNVDNTFSNDSHFRLYSQWQIDRYIKEGVPNETRDSYRALFEGKLKDEFDGWEQTVGYEGGVFSGAYTANTEVPDPLLEVLMLQTASPALKGFSPWNVDDFAEVYVDQWLFSITVHQFKKVGSLIGEQGKDYSLFINSKPPGSAIFFLDVDMPNKKIILSSNLVRAIFLNACFDYLRDQAVVWTKEMPKPHLANQPERSIARLYGNPSPKFDRLRYKDVTYGSFANEAAKAVKSIPGHHYRCYGHGVVRYHRKVTGNPH